MQKAGEKISSWLKRASDKWQVVGWQPQKWLKLFLESLQAKAWLRCALAVVVALAGVLIIYGMDDANQEAMAGGARIVSDEAESLRSQEKNWLAIKGLEAASSQGALRNPFAPDHAYREAAEKSQPDKLANKRLSADIGQAAASVNVQAGVAPAAAKAQSGLAPIPAGRQVNTEDKQIYLQGIIEMDGSPGALLTLKGQNKFLLAGESWQGYTVESIGEDAIWLGGRQIAIGESMAL